MELPYDPGDSFLKDRALKMERASLRGGKIPITGRFNRS